MVEQRKIEATSLDQRIDSFKGVVRSTKQLGDGDGGNGDSSNDSLDFVGESSSLGEALFSVHGKGSATSDDAEHKHSD